MLRWLLLCFVFTCASLSAQVYEGKTLVKASLVADTTAITPGKPFQVGILLEMADKWHTYWQYSGDAGMPTGLKWTLPPGFATGPIEWPLPHRLMEPGDIEVYAYGGRTLLMVTVVPPAQLTAPSVTLKVQATWLVCAEICVPGKADLELTLPASGDAQPANAGLFQEFRSQVPSAERPPYELSWKKEGGALVLNVSGLGNATAVDVYPLPAEDQQMNHPKDSPVTDGRATVTFDGVTGDLQGVLVVEKGTERQSWMISSGEGQGASSTPVASVGLPGFWLALLYGFLGGLILNLMPCVLPVISLKIFGFVRQAGDHPEKILRHGLAFVAGIFLWFLALATLIIALKSAGHQVTWAFQFQNPWFNLVIGSIVFVFALNLFGVFEIVLPGGATNAMAEASDRGGYAGSFFQGIFATLLATPCTAPFLGSALGFAFAQSAGVILLMFAAIALGMAAPYFLLSAKPGWMKVLPKPGPWMEYLKQFMGFPLLATLVWLWSVLGSQKGSWGMTWASAFLLCLALACWIYGTFTGPLARPARRLLAVVAAVIVAVVGGWYFLGKFAEAKVERTEAVSFQKTLDGLLAEKKAVFVDFTADWCISCKFNERTVLNTPTVKEAFRKDGVQFLKADWTNSDPEITAALQKFGRVGVPFYVLYPAGRPNDPIVLPELLTQQIVLDALARAK